MMTICNHTIHNWDYLEEGTMQCRGCDKLIGRWKDEEMTEPYITVRLEKAGRILPDAEAAALLASAAERVAKESAHLRAEIDWLRGESAQSEIEVADWISVFGHISESPDEAGNLINERMDGLQRELAEARGTIRNGAELLTLTLDEVEYRQLKLAAANTLLSEISGQIGGGLIWDNLGDRQAIRCWVNTGLARRIAEHVGRES